MSPGSRPDGRTDVLTDEVAVAEYDDPQGGDLDLADDSDDVLEDELPGRGLGWLLIIGGLLALVASWALTVERIEILKNPDYIPTCSINPIISCGSVMTSSQAELFGFPNPLIGLMSFPVVIMTGILVVARVYLPQWFWRWMQFGVTYAFAFVIWLMIESLYSIGALCPYCMVVWVVTIPIFWRVTGYNLASGNFGYGVADSAVARFLNRYHWLMSLLTFAVIITLILVRFWYYWSSLI